MKKLRAVPSLLLFTAAAIDAQEPSRNAAIEAAQNAKATALRHDPPNKVERWLLFFKEERVMERVIEGYNGFRPKIGGLVPGSGFAIGPEFHNSSLAGGFITTRAAAQASWRGYQRYELEFNAPRIGDDRFFAQLYSVHHNYPSLNYYGPGAGSEKTGRTDFRLEDTAVDATFGIRPAAHVTAGASTGYLWNRLGSGTDDRFASTEQVYTPAQAPGLGRAADYLRAGGFVQYDWRDKPGGPRRGGNYFAQFSHYRDQTLGLGDFQRLDLEAQQYVSLFNQRRVLALRARSVLTFQDGGRFIPFYMQPSLGGSEDLRGYRPFRFRDNNSFVSNAEYRWEVFSGLDMALFADCGKVFARRSDFDLSNLESDVGFGFRFNVRNNTFLRLDAGFSHEGFQVWVKFNNVFRKGPVHTSSSMGDL